MQEEINKLKKEVEKLKKIIDSFVKPDRFYFGRDIEFPSKVNIRISSKNDDYEGTKIGTGTGQRIGFFGVMPVAQRGAPLFPSIADVTGADTVSKAVINANFSSIESAFDDIIQALSDLGLTAPQP